jgi:hypothetical protein
MATVFRIALGILPNQKSKSLAMKKPPLTDGFSMEIKQYFKKGSCNRLNCLYYSPFSA